MEPTRVRLTRALERAGVGPWRTETHKSAMTKGQFLEVVTELLDADVHGQVEQLVAERADQLHAEGAAWALIAALKAGLLTGGGMEAVGKAAAISRGPGDNR